MQYSIKKKEPMSVDMDTHRTGSIALHGHRDSFLYRGERWALGEAQRHGCR